ncbi:hypothetical protein DL768_004391 [Monosporascus sp. mg162]|nr:hypothetical protein DL768_004391 [Monosporascus sp. mg162]
METLPPEIVLTILDHCVASHYGDKNALLSLRTVCKLFDDILKPIVLRTLQLEFTRLDKVSRTCRPLDEEALRRIGHLCQALYLDMMMIRDDGEVRYLGKIFSQVPTMDYFMETLRERYCMNEDSFTELDYRERLGNLLEHTPNMSAVRLNLPFQLISHHCRAATMILGNTMEALAQRPEDSMPLRTLVVENLTDTTVVKLWHNPRDVKNIMDVFSGLEHLILSVRRHEPGQVLAVIFRNRLWEMIGKAPNLKSLCLVGLDVDEKQAPSQSQYVKTTTERDLTLDEWQFRSMPTIRKPPKSVLPYLACLELRRVEVAAYGLISMFKCFSTSLRELYLDYVYLKTVYASDSPEETDDSLWVGLPNIQPPPNHRWVAVHLRQMRAQLRVCRASNLGYDQYILGDLASALPPTYDLRDPSGLLRPLEQRFVEVVLGYRQPPDYDGSPVAFLPEDPESQPWALADREPLSQPRRSDADFADLAFEDPKTAWWSAENHLESASHRKNTTSGWQRNGIDGRFPNCNPFTLHELQHIADTALEGMSLVQMLEGGRLQDEILADLAAVNGQTEE